MQQAYISVVNDIKVASRANNRFCFVKNCNFSWLFLKFLYEKGFIYSFSFYSEKLLKVHLKSDNRGKGLLRRITLISKPTRRVFFKKRKFIGLLKRYGWNSYFLTPVGFCSLYELMKLISKGVNLCGELIFILSDEVSSF